MTEELAAPAVNEQPAPAEQLAAAQPPFRRLPLEGQAQRLGRPAAVAVVAAQAEAAGRLSGFGEGQGTSSRFDNSVTGGTRGW